MPKCRDCRKRKVFLERGLGSGCDTEGRPLLDCRCFSLSDCVGRWVGSAQRNVHDTRWGRCLVSPAGTMSGCHGAVPVARAVRTVLVRAALMWPGPRSGRVTWSQSTILPCPVFGLPELVGASTLEWSAAAQLVWLVPVAVAA